MQTATYIREKLSMANMTVSECMYGQTAILGTDSGAREYGLGMASFAHTTARDK